MNKIVLGIITSLALTSCAYAEIYPSDWQPLAKVSVGLMGGSINGVAVGFNLGASKGPFDASLAYMRGMGTVDSDKTDSSGANVSLVGPEVGYTLSLGDTSIRAFGSLGMAFTELNGRDKADNEVYETLGVTGSHKLTESLHVELGLSGMFLNVHTSRTDYPSHHETLSTGQDVETFDIVPVNNSLQLNSAIINIALVYKF